MKKRLLLGLLFLSNLLVAQNDTVVFTPLGQYNYPVWNSTFKPLLNRQGQPYLYAASKEYGFVTFNISNVNAPAPVNTIPTASFATLKPTYVEQENNFLYVGLGDFQGADQIPGLAILDATVPQSPVIVDQWDTTAWTHGVSSVLIANGYAYVCAMEDGLIILDVSTPGNIQFVSQFLPDTNFGNPPYAPTARGCSYRNDTLLLAFDAGGLRMIDVSIKTAPAEIGQYVNTSLTSVANAAYNQVVWIGDYAYVPVDYCGLEVINVAVPSNMYSMAWNNPWNCIGLSWFGSDGHANQIVYLANEQIVMVSGGDAEVLVFDASNPSQPDIIGWWGPSNDLGGSWGIDVLGNLVAVGRADNPFNSPFPADTGGVKLLQWQFIMNSTELTPQNYSISLSPNPSENVCNVLLPNVRSEKFTIEVCDISGRILIAKDVNQNETGSTTSIDISTLASGMYIVTVFTGEIRCSQRLIKQ